MKPPSEFEIQRALCLWLDGNPDKDGVPRVQPALRPDAIYFHTPNGGARDAAEGKRFKMTGVKAGIFDITFLCGGQFYVLELKDEKGTLSKAQEAMWQRYITAGAAGIGVANSLQLAKDFCKLHRLTN